MSATVLVVDDLPANVKLLEVKLNAEYYDILTAKSGIEALEVVKTQPVDIILLDVMMPDMDGFEACRHLKTNPKTSHIPVVMVTALSEIKDRITGLEAGADDFLTKPIDDVALFARIKSLVRTKIMLDELRLRDQTTVEFGGFGEGINLDPSGANILVVDDDFVQSKQIVNKLSTLDFVKVQALQNPAETIEKVSADDFDLVIISTQLAAIDGLRLCSQMRSHESTRHIPILILVDDSDKNLLIKGLDMGVSDYIMTPIEGNELIARVKTQIKRKRYQDALKSNYTKNVNMAMTDALTGVYNRRYFDAHSKNLVDQAHNLGKPLLFIMVDIDHFKKVNDTYGHQAGDVVIKDIAKILNEQVRLTDMVARFGGEEFVVIMPNTSQSDGEAIAERLRLKVANYLFKISETESINKTMSLGVAMLLPGEDKDKLLARADKALYEAKESGRNKYVIAT